ADVGHRRAVDTEGVDADEGDAVLAVVEHGRPDLARVVEGLVVRLAVPARLLRADRRGDVPLGEPGLEGRGLAAGGGEGEGEGGEGRGEAGEHGAPRNGERAGRV